MRTSTRAFLVLFASLLWPLIAASVAVEDGPRLRQSWIAIDEATTRRELKEGERFEVAVEYDLHGGPAATLELLGLGQWIDNPDGTYTTKRFHVDLPGLRAHATVQPGRGRQVFAFTVPVLAPHSTVLWLAQFREVDGGKAWPWQVRAGGGPLRRPSQPIAIVSAQPGNLFTYAQPVTFDLVAGDATVAGEDHVAAWSLIDCNGAPAGAGTLAFRSSGPGQRVALPLALERRGVFGLRVEVAGWGVAETTFARIPDVMALTAGKPTPFGLHHLVRPGASAEGMDVARRLGLTWCRTFASWISLQPAPGEWRLDGWDAAFDLAKAKGIATAICLVDPPPWVLRDSLAVRFGAFDFDRDAWRATIATLAGRWKGRIASWEWLNEIVPSGASHPVDDYLDFCRIGTEAAKAADPAVVIQLAGGLWPRNFRRALLSAGIARHIDVLPVHYSNGAAVEEARADLAAVGAQRVAAWDNETGRGLSTWGMPQAVALRSTEQRDWVIERWSSELAAGAERIVYFGGSGDAAGNWDYSYEDHTPRPVAATLAVLASKLHAAIPQGSFGIGASGPFHLFLCAGKAVLVVPRQAPAAMVDLRVGSATVVLTGDQGEELPIATTAGTATIPLGAHAAYVEGGDLEILRAYTAPSLRTPELAVLAGRGDAVVVDLLNRSDKPIAGTVALEMPAGLAAPRPVPFTLAGGASSQARLEFAVPADAAAGERQLRLATRFADARLPEVAATVKLLVLAPAQLGNLLSDGGFEDGGRAWSVGKGASVAGAGEFAEGLGSSVLRFAGTGNAWAHAGQAIPVQGGRSYLYTAWVRNHDMEAGSNIDQTMIDGSTKSLFTPAVFIAGDNNPDWLLASCIYRPAATVAKASFAPVTKGEGWATYDNVRVTLYEGTSYAAEATRAATRPIIDGRLDDWAAGCPIPLLGPGQLTRHDPAYAWTAANCRGVARLAWDDEGLYLAAVVEDDRHVATTTGERTADGDSLVLALHPANRASGADAKAFAYLISSASPGGGSGATTLFRPADRSGGLSSGQLAKDSSLYELAIVTTGTRTVYELRMPWSELGCSGRLGAKLGCSLQLNDNDGAGPAASIGWGDGLLPAWNPAGFGVVTLVE